MNKPPSEEAGWAERIHKTVEKSHAGVGKELDLIYIYLFRKPRPGEPPKPLAPEEVEYKRRTSSERIGKLEDDAVRSGGGDSTKKTKEKKK